MNLNLLNMNPNLNHSLNIHMNRRLTSWHLNQDSLLVELWSLNQIFLSLTRFGFLSLTRISTVDPRYLKQIHRRLSLNRSRFSFFHEQTSFSPSTEVSSCCGWVVVCAILRGKYVTFQNHGWFVQTRILMDFMEHLEDVEMLSKGSSAHYWSLSG